MFAFNPGVNDMSGQILGQAAVGAAQTTAGAQQQMASDIGSSLVSLAAAYGAKKGTEAKGKNFKKFMGMAGDTFGMDSAMFGDMDDYDAGMMLDNFGSWMPAMANAQLGKQRMDQMPVMQAQKVTDQREIMYEREQLARERQAMSSPPPPAAITVPPAMRRFGNPNNP
jgi:hypothetical protein